MPTNKTKADPIHWLPLALAGTALLWRSAKAVWGLPDVLPGFSPWLALAFAGSALMPRQLAWWLWPALLLGTDLLLQPGDISGTWSIYLCLAAVAIMGGLFRRKANAIGVIGGTALCAIGFYFLTSTQAWLVNPIYAKSLQGWLQAMTIGDPAFSPQAWVFAVRSILSESIFAFILVVAYNAEAISRGLNQLSWAPVSSSAKVLA